MEIYYWRPRTLFGAGLARFSRRYRHKFHPSPTGKRNFGDELGPLILERILALKGLRPLSEVSRASKPTFFSVGSVTHVARNGDIIWGSGALGGIKPTLSNGVRNLEIYALRGPLTRRSMIDDHGLKHVPSVFGDPAILVGKLFPELLLGAKTCKALVVSHIDDDPEKTRHGLEYASANCDPFEMIQRISQAESVITSSLHGKIVADSLGVPSVLYQGRTTKAFKFDDYSLAVLGEKARIYPTFDSALGAPKDPMPELGDIGDDLLKSFPSQLFSKPN